MPISRRLALLPFRTREAVLPWGSVWAAEQWVARAMSLRTQMVVPPVISKADQCL